MLNIVIVAVERKQVLIRHLNPDELSDEELVALSELEARVNDNGDYEVVDAPRPRDPLVKRPA